MNKIQNFFCTICIVIQAKAIFPFYMDLEVAIEIKRKDLQEQNHFSTMRMAFIFI